MGDGVGNALLISADPYRSRMAFVAAWPAKFAHLIRPTPATTSWPLSACVLCNSLKRQFELLNCPEGDVAFEDRYAVHSAVYDRGSGEEKHPEISAVRRSPPRNSPSFRHTPGCPACDTLVLLIALQKSSSFCAGQPAISSLHWVPRPGSVVQDTKRGLRGVERQLCLGSDGPDFYRGLLLLQ